MEKRLEAASRCLEERYPHASFAVMGGSSASGLAGASSDLDLVIVDSSEPYPFRQSFWFEGYPVEAFIVTSRSYTRFFEEAVQSGLPTILRLLGDGIVIKPNSQFTRMTTMAKKLLDEGPEPCSLAELDEYRYEITEQLTDFESISDPGEALFILLKMSDLVQKMQLRANRQWLGEGKWAARALKAYQPQQFDQYVKAIAAFVAEGDKSVWVDYVEAVLQECGGRFFEGYYSVYYE
ncbi:nucleotidyltransferase domain-containing protein [Marinicrinis sediminis]|uniref:Nucleotidyltransferase domain-containing protein n=1 Tax=Marinicrinis sediminis TaxID=1652465 RepID=A0ABW5RFD1_9BACL